MDKVEDKANDVAENIKDTFSKVTSVSFKDFVQSNTLVSKVAFTLLVMFGFFILLKFSITFIPKIMKDSNSPHIFDGTVEGSHGFVVPQDPHYENSITINRSVNERNGIEFSWSIWLYLDDNSIASANNVHIFHKGDSKLMQPDSTSSDQYHFIAAPGLYLKNNMNTLVVKMNSFGKDNNTIEVEGIPMNKWVNVVIRVKGKRVDIYINGTIKRSYELDSVPKQNYGDIYVAQNPSGGASLAGSKLSDLWYFDHALNVYEIEKLVMKGPNKKLVTSSAMTDKSTSYLAFDWYN